MLTWTSPRLISRKPTPPIEPPHDDELSPPDSGIDPPQEVLPRKEEEQVDEKLPRKQVREENEEIRVGAQEILPRQRDRRDPDEKLPRKQSAQPLGDIAGPDADQSPPTPEIEETRPQEPSQRESDERVNVDQKSPRKRSEQIPGDIARPDVGQSLPTPGNAEEPEKDPRKKG